jgi:hypothetical protein
MYHAGVDKHLTFSGGYELNPVFRDDIRGLRLFSFRFWLLMLFVGGLLLILHSLDLPEVFSFVWGMFVCIQIAIHLRHIRNLAVFYHARDSKGMSGRIEYQALAEPAFVIDRTIFIFNAISVFIPILRNILHVGWSSWLSFAGSETPIRFVQGRKNVQSGRSITSAWSGLAMSGPLC